MAKHGNRMERRAVMNNGRGLQVAAGYSFSGPLPHPDLLKGYNDLIPNGAERIMAQAEKQTDHRIKIESRVVNSNIRREITGQWMGYSIVATILIYSIILINKGRAIEGRIAIGGECLGLVGLFIYNKNSQNKGKK